MAASLSSATIRGNQAAPERAISGHQRSSGAIRQHLSEQSEVIRGYQRSSEVIRQHLSEAEGWHPQCHLPSVSLDEGVKGGASAHCGANGFDRRLN